VVVILIHGGYGLPGDEDLGEGLVMNRLLEEEEEAAGEEEE